MCAPADRIFGRSGSSTTQTEEFAGGLSVVLSRRSPFRETPNQDCAAVIPLTKTTGILVVADGVGGAPSGDLASLTAIKTLIESVTSVPTGDDLRPAILNGLERANEQVMLLGSGSLTTIAVVEVNGREIRPYHVGDSVIMITGQRGRLKLQTVCHSPVGYAVEAGVLTEAEAMNHDQRHLVLNVLGTPDMRIEVGAPIRMAARDTLLLGTDGLFDNLSMPEIIETMRCGGLTASIQQLADVADQRMRAEHPQGDTPSKPDDLTMIAFRPWRPRSHTGPSARITDGTTVSA